MTASGVYLFAVTAKMTKEYESISARLLLEMNAGRLKTKKTAVTSFTKHVLGCKNALSVPC